MYVASWIYHQLVDMKSYKLVILTIVFLVLFYYNCLNIKDITILSKEWEGEHLYYKSKRRSTKRRIIIFFWYHIILSKTNTDHKTRMVQPTNPISVFLVSITNPKKKPNDTPTYKKSPPFDA